MTANLSILITGATGYIGGSVLSQLLSSPHPAVKNLDISVTVRRQDQADILAAQGVKPILIKDLDDLKALTDAARDHDIVINTANSFHASSAEALILGLSERKKQTKANDYFIHTSGTSNLGDKHITKEYIETREFSDKTNIYEYEQYREDMEQYAQRTTDLTVVRTGENVGVPTFIIMSPLIYGFGTGLFNKKSIQIPQLSRAAISKGTALHVGDGLAAWNHVHIADLAALYVIILNKVLSGADVPSGRKGIYFSAGGRYTWLSLAQSIGKAGVHLGALKTAVPTSLTVEEAAQILTGGNTQRAQLGYASRSVTNADMARELGWKPSKTDADWEESIVEEFKYILGKDNLVL